MWVDLSIATVAFVFGMFCQWYLRLKRPFQLHMKFPNGQILAFSIPTEMFVAQNGDQEPLRLQINDDGQPPPQAPQPQPQPQPVAQANLS